MDQQPLALSIDVPLPLTALVSRKYPWAISVTNTSDRPVAGIVVTRGYPTGCKETLSTLSGTLASGGTGRIEGNFSPGEEGNFTIAITVTLPGGDVVDASLATTARLDG